MNCSKALLLNFLKLNLEELINMFLNLKQPKKIEVVGGFLTFGRGKLRDGVGMC